MPKDTVSRILARHVLGIRYESLPTRVITLAKVCIMDQLGVQLRGATLPWAQPAYSMVRDMGCRGESTVVYYGDRTNASYAAYVNSTFGHSCEMDDQGVGTHAGAIVVAPSIALGEVSGASGNDLIRAVVAGYEAMGRIGLTKSTDTRGFHMIDAPFAAATSAGILLELDEDAMVNAYGIAGSHSGGLTEYDQVGGEVKRLHAGLGSRGGVQCAILANKGLTGPRTVFEGRRGIVQAFRGPDANPQNIVNGLGKDDYQITRNIFKFYPCNISIHTSLDALNMVMARHPIDHRDVKEINVGVNSNLAHYTTITRPNDVIGAQFSLAFGFGLRLVTGKTDDEYEYFEDYLNPRKWTDADILRIADLVKPYVLPEAVNDLNHLAKVQIKVANGRAFYAVQQYCTGGPQHRQTVEQEVKLRLQLEAKFRMLARVALPDKRIDQILEAVRNLEDLPKVSELVALLVK